MDYILQERIVNGHTEYLVKWSYETHAHNTWLLEDEIIELGHEDILKQYYENFQPSAYGEQFSYQEEISSSGNTRGRKKKKIQKKVKIIKLSGMRLKIPVKSEVKNHWIFGNYVEEIKARDDNSQTYEIIWENGCEDEQSEDTLLEREPQKLCLFLEKELKKASHKRQI